MSYQLSICIPTYNREKYLKQLLDCIFNQLKYIYDENVEVCVSDNASTDGTQTMLQEYRQNYNNITYFRWDKNMGADNNYLKVVEIAHSEYCWFFGSDDLMVDGAIKKILGEIKENHDIYLCNRIECDINMNQLKKSYIFKENNPQIFSFDNKNNLIYYFQNLMSLNGLFTYLSSIIFRKTQWKSIQYDKIFIGTAYIHSYILLSIINKKETKLKYICDHLALNRSGNDAFLDAGIIKRIKLDFDGFKMLFDKIFNDKNLDNYYKFLLKRAYPYYRLLNILSNLNKKDRQILLNIIKPAGHNMFILKYGHVIFKIFPYSLFRIIYRKINQLRIKYVKIL